MKTAAGVAYLYDGSGRRVSKSNGKLYWYGSGGEILAETNASGATLNEYIFFGGKRVAMLPAGGNPIYYAEDLLGSSRVITQNNGAVCYDADFDPYGGEHPYTNNCPSSNAYKFEGKERDAETGNDNFGARYNSSNFGRFMSPDPDGAGASPDNPQSWNAYAYVLDNPINNTDPDGMDSCEGRDPGSCVEVTANADTFALLSFDIGTQLRQAAQKSYDYLHSAYQMLINSRAGCTAGYTALGAASGAYAGARTGSLIGAGIGAFAGVGIFDEATVPSGAAIGGGLLGGYGAIKGGQVGYAAGQALCSTGTGSGGGGSSASGRGSGSKVRFGNNANQEYHTFRHVEEAGINKQAAEDAIRSDLAGKEDSLPQGLTNGQVQVGGRVLDYVAYKLSDGTMNVGRITVQ